ncbi:serine hydrolase domain-containing protein [Myroides sp. LJL110]
MTTKKNTTLLLSALLSTGALQAQDTEFLTAKQSEPEKFGWMQGFPPKKDRVLSAQDGSFFEFPALRYSVMHMREFLPTKNVSQGLEAPIDFPYELDSNIDKITFTVTNTHQTMSWEESLWANYTDGIIILHKGKVVYERYLSDFTPQNVHATMSLTKSFTGTLASILVAQGILDPQKTASYYVPELKNSAFADATIRQIMDMTTALKYSEDYSDPNADVWKFSQAGSHLINPKTHQGPVGYYQFLETIKKQGNHGEIFRYKTVNSDALGWIISRSTNKSIPTLLSELIWSKIGAEQDAYYQVDALGIAFAGGGLNAGLRDLARFGELIRNQGQFDHRQIIPKQAILDIEKGGNKQAFAKSENHQLKGWSYRNMWWITENKNRAFTARGVHGQAIYIDPTAQMVIVRLASHPIAANKANDPTSLPAYQAVADYLMHKK